MRDRLKMLFRYRGTVQQAHPHVLGGVIGVMASPATDRNLVSARNHAAPDLFNACFEATICRGHASRTNERDVHCWSRFLTVETRELCSRRGQRMPQALPGGWRALFSDERIGVYFQSTCSPFMQVD